MLCPPTLANGPEWRTPMLGYAIHLQRKHMLCHAMLAIRAVDRHHADLCLVFAGGHLLALLPLPRPLLPPLPSTLSLQCRQPAAHAPQLQLALLLPGSLIVISFLWGWCQQARLCMVLPGSILKASGSILGGARVDSDGIRRPYIDSVSLSLLYRYGIATVSILY